MHSLRDKVRAVCHYLRMHPLTKVDASVVSDIRSRIAKLPSPESISSMPRPELINLKNRLDRLMFDMDNSDNSRTQGFAVRHMVEKGLPPRMAPVLARNWYERAIIKSATVISNSITPDG